jgi:hypothetical protein
MKNNKARIGNKNGRYKGIPSGIDIYIISGFLIGLSPYILSVRINIGHKIKISPNRIRTFLKSKGIDWRNWKKNGIENT